MQNEVWLRKRILPLDWEGGGEIDKYFVLIVTWMIDYLSVYMFIICRNMFKT